jgi:uncharacterized membrane protein
MTRQIRVLIVATVLLASLGLSLYFWGRMPEVVPVHFNGAGQADNFGSRASMLILFPAVEVFLSALYLFAVFMVQRPVSWQKRVRRPVSEDDMEKIKLRGAGLLDWTLVVCMGLFLEVQLESFMVATQAAEKLSRVPMILIGLMMAGALYHVVQMFALQYRIIKKMRSGPPGAV